MQQSKYNLGLVSISFRKHSPREILDAMKAARLTHIEWGSDVHAPCTDLDKVKQIADLQKEYGITCSSYGTYFRLGVTPIEELEGYIAAAKLLGTNVLRLWCGDKSGEDMTKAQKDELIAQCKRAAEIAERHGTVLCMECHKKTFTQNLGDALGLMKAMNSLHFGMYWQPFQWQTVEQNLAYAEAIAPYAHHIHVFQWKDAEKFSLVEGIGEWQAYLGKFSTPRTLLLEFMPDDKLSTLQREADALRMIIGG